VSKPQGPGTKATKTVAATPTDEGTTLEFRRHNRSRRRLLQTLTVGGAAVTVKSLPEQWARPALDIAVLPTHAQATCQAESLDCAVDTILVDAGDARHADPDVGVPVTEGNNFDVDRIADLSNDVNLICGTAPTFDDFTNLMTFPVRAVVDPACEPVVLESDLSGDPQYSLETPATQNGVVDPDNGSVAFNNVVVGFDVGGYTVDESESLTAVLELRFRTPGSNVSDCVINITFTEVFPCES